MPPPENAIVLAVDEKPSIQALERAQGYLKLPNGRAMITNGTGRRRCSPRSILRAARLSGVLQETPARRVPRLHEPSRHRLSGARNSCCPRQSLHPQAQARHVAETE